MWKYAVYPSGTVFQFINVPPAGSGKSNYHGPMMIGTKKEANTLLAALIIESTTKEVVIPPCPRNCNLPSDAYELGFTHCPYCGRSLNVDTTRVFTDQISTPFSCDSEEEAYREGGC